MKVAILRDDNPESSAKWELACEKQGVECRAVSLLRSDWLEQLNAFSPSFCVSRPPGDLQHSKTVFDEAFFFIEHFTPYKVFPGFLETVIYENKASLAWFLKANNIAHPETFVSSSREEAFGFLKNSTYPVVAKTLIGAAGSGVKLLNSQSDAEAYVNQAFTKGIKRRYGPNRKTGNPKTWLAKAVKSPGYFLKKLRQYRERDSDIQKGVVFFQKYVPHSYEWRCAKIGASYFAYKKLKVDDQASGAKQFEYGAPPKQILDFTKNLCEAHGFQFMAVDLFPSDNGLLVNELQTIFGHKNPYICKVDGKPGRYLFRDNQWVFEEGDFNTNESYDLRLQTAIELYEKGCS